MTCSLSRIPSRILTTGLALLVVVSVISPAVAKPQRPNVLVFLVDDMGVMDTSVPFLTDSSGKPERHPLNDYYRTPNMERLAAQGVRFGQFAAMNVCSPSRISLVTGQHAARHRTTNWIHPDRDNRSDHGPPEWNWAGLKVGDVTLPRVLKEQGYQTIHVGKAHFGPRSLAGADPVQVGFQVNIAGGSIGHPASYFAEQRYGNPAPGSDQPANPNAVPGLEKYHESGLFLTEALTREANSQLRQAVASQQPFFLHLSHYAVHSPFQADPRFADHYPVNPEFPNWHKFATLIEGMDQSLGDVLDQLTELGVAEETLVIFLGDNGSDAPLKNEHGISSSAPLRGKKATHYEGGIRAPLIIGWAKPNPENALQQKFPVAEGVVQTQLVTICDLFPTVLAACEVAAPETHLFDGRSLQQLLTGQADETHPTSFLVHFPHEHRSPYFTSYREGDWKVVYHYLPGKSSGGKRYELFNLAKDPSEQHDLAATRPDQLRRLMQGLIRQLQDYSAVYPVEAATNRELLPQLP